MWLKGVIGDNQSMPAPADLGAKPFPVLFSWCSPCCSNSLVARNSSGDEGGSDLISFICFSLLEDQVLVSCCVS